MNSQTNSRSPVSYKETGDKNVTPEVTKMSPQERAIRVIGRRVNVDKLFAQLSLVDIVDPTLSDAAFRLKALLKVPTADGKPACISSDEIAEALERSPRQIKRIKRELEDHGDVEVERRHNCRNEYAVKGHAVPPARVEPAADGKKAKKDLVDCPKCHKPCGWLLKVGWCRRCARKVEMQDTARRAARQELETLLEEKLA